MNSAVFPGLQGGPLMHVIAAKAVAFGEALTPHFKLYSKQVVQNAKILSDTLLKREFNIVSGGTDTHLVLVDLSSKGIKGNDAEKWLERADMTCNKNSIPFDPEKPTITSGIRLGTPAGTTRGFGIIEFEKIGEIIADILDSFKLNPEDNSEAELAAKEKVRFLCNHFPIYSKNN